MEPSTPSPATARPDIPATRRSHVGATAGRGRVAVDAQGNLYIADGWTYRIRKSIQSGKNAIAAVNAVTGAYIGATGLVSGGSFTPHHNEYLTLYATGFGGTNPSFDAGARRTSPRP